MKTTFLLLLLSAPLLFAACRGRESMASKSAQAYEKAVQAGLPIGGDGHGDHAVAAAPDHAAMEHASMGQPSDHAAMGHQTMEHATSGGMRGHAGMGHEAQAQQPEHAGHAMTQPTPTDQQPHQPAQMDHAATGHAAAPPASAGQRAFPISEAPASSREMAQLRPSSTLSSDPQDAPALTAVGEAQKAAAAATTPHARHAQPQPSQEEPRSHDHGSER